MRGPRLSVRFLVGLLTAALLGSCGGSDEGAVPTPELLAESLLTADDLGGEWQLAPDANPGLLSEEAKATVSLELCEEAGPEAVAAAAALDWQAGTQFTRGASPARGFGPFVQEVLLAGEPDQLESTFETIRSGAARCIGVSYSSEDGDMTIDDLPLPTVGDDRVGQWHRQAGESVSGYRWDVRTVLVRDGAVMMMLMEIEVTPSADPVVGQTELDGIVTAAVDNLP